MYIYFNSRFIDNDKQMPLTDSGASLKSVYQALSTYKFTSEDVYPYEIQNVNRIPPKNVYDQAIYKMENPIESYRRINPCIYSFKYILNVLKLPIMFGMSVYENFIDLNRENDLLCEPNGEFLGLHAVVIVGYDENCQCFDILNSHGVEFGNDGFF